METNHENGMQRIPVRKVVPENAMAENPGEKRAQLYDRENELLAGCKAERVCNPTEFFEGIEQCLTCGRKV